MLKNYLTIAFRNLRRQTSYAFINVAGLAVGMGVCLLIGLFVQHERSYDRFHEHADRIYRVIHDQEGEFVQGALTPELLGPALATQVPEVEQVVRIQKAYHPKLVSAGERRFYEERFFHADSSFFEVFSFRLRHGDPTTVLDEPGSVVLTASMAAKYFPGTTPLGQTLTYEGTSYRITGIMDDVPDNAHFHFDFLARLEPSFEQWYMYTSYTYVLLHADARPSAVQGKLSGFVETHINPQLEQGSWGALRLQPLTRIHLHSNVANEIEPNSDVRYLYIFSFVALLVLLIACINYMNLATARSTHRAREVGVRKVLGAHRLALVRQFLGESVLMTLVALLLGLGLTELSLPVLNTWTGKSLSLAAPGAGWLVGFCMVIVLLAGVAAGLYPAVYLSRFHPVRVLRGAGHASPSGLVLRRFLVIAQFAGSIALLIATVVMYNQLAFLQNARLGFDKEHVVVISDWERVLQDSYASFKHELLQDPRILHVAAGHRPDRDGGITHHFTDDATGEVWELRMVSGDFDYPNVLGLTFTAGPTAAINQPGSHPLFIANELAVARMNWDEPLDETFAFWGGEGPIVGVVENAHMRSLHEPVQPMLIRLEPGHSPDILVRISPENVSAALAAVERTWSAFAPSRPLLFSFLENDLDALYQAEQRLARIFIAFAALAIFIACLGLFGLAAFTAQARTKEIGIRKVLGASVTHIVALLSKDFARLVLIAVVVAAPLAYIAMDRWLADFSYRIELSWTIFLLAGLTALGIALLTVSYQAVKAALTNPVQALRDE